MSADIQMILSRLEGVKEVGGSAWTALCPAHADRTPSLKVTLFDSGKIGVICRAGCAFHEIADAMGLTESAFFPTDRRKLRPKAGYLPASAMLRVLGDDIIFVASVLRTLSAAHEALGRDSPLTEWDVERFYECAENFALAQRVCGVAP
ncbi:MAG: hypothetical protein LBQ75_02720 [Zoogloeaceae bacterium]|jgi:hypothetical protein|nr:hypothetical protein [Zoogloeaceae bacterium]